MEGTSKTIRLSAWATLNGFSYKGAYRLWRRGEFPVETSQLKSGTILVHLPTETTPGKAAIYVRVSSHDQKQDLERQAERLALFALSKGINVNLVVREVGSGLNGRRPKLKALLRDSHTTMVLVEHRDRLVRFGYDYIESALNSSGRVIIVADESEGTLDLVKDFVDVVTSMCAKIYGARSARNRATRALEEASRVD